MKPERAFTAKEPVDRILSIVHTIQAEYQSKLQEAQRAIFKLEERARSAATDWQTERQRLQQEIASLKHTVDTGNTRAAEDSLHLGELERKLGETLQLKAGLASDFQRLVSELSALEQSSAAGDEPDHGAYRGLRNCRFAAHAYGFSGDAQRRLRGGRCGCGLRSPRRGKRG